MRSLHAVSLSALHFLLFSMVFLVGFVPGQDRDAVPENAAGTTPPASPASEPSATEEGVGEEGESGRLADLLGDLSWRAVGPAEMGGRIVDIEADPSRSSTFYVASASGGLFKTTNNGISFEALFQDQGSISIGDVAVARSDPSTIWLGTGEANPRNSVSWGDGVYVSHDGGRNWEHRGLEDTHHIGRIAINPTDPDIVFVAAVGHTWGPNPERGLYRTRDGGKSWERVLWVDDQTGCIDVLIDPLDPRVVFAATYERQRDAFDGGDPVKRFGPGSGIWRSQDGGEHFERLTQGLPAKQMGRIGLDVYDSDPGVLYAIIETEMTGRTVPGQQGSGPASIGARGRNHESGFELVAILEGRPAEKAGLQVGDVIIRIGEHPITAFGDLVEAQAEHRPGDEAEVAFLRAGKEQTVTVTFDSRSRGPSFSRGSQGGQTANVQDRQGQLGVESGGVFRTDDGGETWQRINSLDPRPFYYSQIRIDPSSDQRIYVLGVSFHRSTDGGKTFDTRAGRGVHPDHHALWIDPDDPDHLLLGNDGGLYVTYDRCRTWEHVDRFVIGQFYNVAVDMRTPYRVYGGLQDNGCWGGPSASHAGDGISREGWTQVNGGDGFHCAVDPTNPDIIYCESQNGAMVRRDLATGSMRLVDRPRREVRFNWNTPFFLSPHNPRTIYFAGNHVYRSIDQGLASDEISPEITRTDRGSATALAESPLQAGLLYVGTDDGALWVSRNGGVAWEDLHERLPVLASALYVSDIEPSAHDPATVYVSVDGHRSDDYQPHLLRSVDYGDTWEDLSGGLPEGAIRCLVEHPDEPKLLFVGTEFGCFASIDGGGSWARVGGALPTVAVHDLVIHPRDGDLVAATHGRGIWIGDVSALREMSLAIEQGGFHLFAVKDALIWPRKPSAGGYSRFNGFRAEDPAEGVVIHYWLAEDQEEDVTLEISDVVGEPVQTVRGPGEAGMHRVVWNLSRGRSRGGRGSRTARGPGGGGFPGARGRQRVSAGDYAVSLTVGEMTQRERVRVLEAPPPSR